MRQCGGIEPASISSLVVDLPRGEDCGIGAAVGHAELLTQSAHASGEQLGAQRSTARGVEAEHETIRGNAGSTDGCPRVHLGKMLSELFDGGLVEADCSAAPRFGLFLDDDSAGIVDRRVDDELVAVEVQPVASQTRQLTSSQTSGRCELEHRGEHFVVLRGRGEQAYQLIQLGCGGVAWRECGGRQLESVDGVAGHLAVNLSPFERAAQQCSGVVHPAARQAGSAHAAEGRVEFGRRDRVGRLVADRLFQPVGVGVCVAGERGVIETSVLSSELEIPGNQTVDRQLLVALA